MQYLPNADPALCRSLGVQGNWRCLGLLSADSDDVTYIALDEATKASTVQVSYARSLYAGAANASTRWPGKSLGFSLAPRPRRCAVDGGRPPGSSPAERWASGRQRLGMEWPIWPTP